MRETRSNTNFADLIFNGDGSIFEDPVAKRERSERDLKLEVVKNIARVSREGIQEKDMWWIIDAISLDRLSIDGLKHLIKFGLEKYVNYSHKSGCLLVPDITCLEAAITGRNLEIVKLLVSIGAKINESVLERAARLRKFDVESWGAFDSKGNAIEIEKFLISEKERQEKAEIEKARMGKNFAKQRGGRTSDVRIHFQDK